MAKVIEEAKNDIPVRDMKDGDVAVITKWEKTTKYNEFIIQRFENKLISIGMDSGYSWETTPIGDNFRVRILPKGTKIEL